MKLIAIAVSALILVAPVHAEEASFKAQPTGCIFNSVHGTCIFSNRGEELITCQITIRGKTERDHVVMDRRAYIIEPHRYRQAEVYATDDPFTKVTAEGVCNITK